MFQAQLLHVPISIPPILCQCGCEAVAQPPHPSLKDTSTENGLDILPPGGVYGYSLHVQEGMGSRDTGVVVPPGQAGLGRVFSADCWGDTRCGASSLHQVQPSLPADTTFPWEEQGWYCTTLGSSLPYPGF